MSQIVTIGASVMDIFVKSDEFSLSNSDQGTLLCQKYGDKIDVDQFAMLSGGGASNTAVGFAKQGYQVKIMTEVGQDFLADQLLAELSQLGIDTQYVSQQKREQTGMSVVLVAPEGGRTILVHRGAASMLEAHDVDWPSVSEASWIHCSNVSGQLELLLKLFSLGKNTQISWNPGKEDLQLLLNNQLPIDTLADVAVLCLNQEEWELLVPVQDRVSKLVQYVVITQGKQGGEVLRHDQSIHRYSIKQVPVIDETGSGDAFHVGFVTGILEGKTVPQACQYGVEISASVVQHLGAKAGLIQLEK